MTENWYCALTRFCTTSVTKHKPELKNISNFTSGEQVGHKSMSTVMLQIILGWFQWRTLALLLSSHYGKNSRMICKKLIIIFSNLIFSILFVITNYWMESSTAFVPMPALNLILYFKAEKINDLDTLH